MAASTSPAGRARRFERRPGAAPTVASPQRLQFLRYVAEYGLVSSLQLRRLLAVSDRTVRVHGRALFDAGLVDLLPVARWSLAEGAPNDAALLYGSAPNVYVLAREGRRLLAAAGDPAGAREVPRYGPRNTPFLSHTLAVRDFRVWLELSAQARPGLAVVEWRDGTEAEIDLGRERPPRRACPDAWFACTAGGRVLVGLLEVDRGTERGLEAEGSRWRQKLAAYAALYASGRLPSVTGYRNARVLVVAPTERRTEALAAFVGSHAPGDLAARFWLASSDALEETDPCRPAWHRAGVVGLAPLLPRELLAGAGAEDGSA